MNKRELRKETIQSLRDMDDVERAQQEQILLKKLIDFIIDNEYKSVGIILSMPHEINTYPIIDLLIDKGIEVYGPACDYDEKVMHFYKMASSKDRTTDEKDIPVPKDRTHQSSDMELLVVPGVAFVETGYRVGYGGGYYDKFLSTFKGDTVSIVFDSQLKPNVPVEFHDIPVDVILSPSKKIHSKELRMNE